MKIAFGTDAGVYPHGDNAKQFAYMVKWGQTPMQAIQAATVNAADLLGWTDKVGAIAPGRFADLIAVDGDPDEGRHAARARVVRHEGRRGRVTTVAHVTRRT